MSKRVLIIVACGVALLGVGWALFRPELLFVDNTVNEAFPASTSRTASASEPELLLEGSFVGLAHETRGTAGVYRLADGKRVLRLTGFETSNGPDVRVLLVKAPSAGDNDIVKSAGYVELGSLKGNVGDQNYDIPEGVDLAVHRAATIWCNRFGVNFGSAALMPAEARAAEPALLTSGTFRSGAHETRGTASIYQLPDGSRVLRLTDFETSNGPDVRVLLVAAEDVSDNDTVKNSKRVELGSLKGNMGDQNYDIPADVLLSQYRSVTIWCNRFGVNFGSALLSS